MARVAHFLRYDAHAADGSLAEQDAASAALDASGAALADDAARGVSRARLDVLNGTRLRIIGAEADGDGAAAKRSSLSLSPLSSKPSTPS